MRRIAICLAMIMAIIMSHVTPALAYGTKFDFVTSDGTYTCATNSYFELTPVSEKDVLVQIKGFNTGENFIKTVKKDEPFVYYPPAKMQYMSYTFKVLGEGIVKALCNWKN